ncbi:hypothetical protein C455_02949 [Haloferax larsenii JCM 13917]|nr:hypothetical protein [Haloferax larsenii]ELZ82133.1 hypothetical protein C455_02949 [Haloferax larsenii JCM 13917]
MFGTDTIGLFAGAVALGVVHGIEPGHGWPVAASYALDQANEWVYGFAASFILGVGHLVSSLAMVAVFFYAKSYFELTQVNEPLTILGGVQIGGPVSLVAGVLLVALGIREYRGGGHSHDHRSQHGHGSQHDHGSHHSHSAHAHSTDDGDDHTREHHIRGHLSDDVVLVGNGHNHDGHGHDERGHDGHSHNDHSHDDNAGILSRLRDALPFAGGHSHGHHGHGHDHNQGLDEATDRGLLGIAWFAFVLGFAHEEEFEIIAMCAGSNYCLELMSTYALTVIFGIVALTMALIAGYQSFESEVEKYTPYLPVFSAAVLILMGVGFIVGLF